MRKLLIAAAAAALMAVAAPGVASAQTGYVGLNYSNGSVEDADFDGFGAEGVVAFDAGALGVQLDAGYSNTDFDGAEDSSDAWSVGGHVYSRGQQWLVGGFAAYTDLDSDANGWTVGAEARRYFNRTTVGAAIAYINSDDLDTDGWQIDGDVKHFYTDNWSVGAGLSFASLDVGANDDADVWGVNVGTEYQFASLPVSLYGQYTHNEISNDDDDADADVVTLGVRWNFGGSLIERDRSGAGLASRGLSIAGLGL